MGHLCPRSLTGILLLAAALRMLALWLGAAWPPVGDEAAYLRAAQSLARHGVQDVFWPPLTGWWLTLLWPLTGGDALVSRACTAALDLLNTALVWAVCRQAVAQDHGARPGAPALAATAYALYLPAIAFACNATSEVPSLALLLGSLWLLGRPALDWRAVSLAGLLLGLLTLARSNLALMGVALGLGLLTRPDLVNRRAMALGLVSLSLLVPCLWAWRNLAHGEGWALAHNGSYNLYMGNAPEAPDELNLFAPAATTAQRAVRAGQGNRHAEQALQLAPDQRQAQALTWIQADPLNFARRALGRLARVWAPKTAQLSLAGGEGRHGLTHPSSLLLLGIGTAQWAVLLWLGLRGLAAWHARRPDLATPLLAALLGALPLCLVAIAKPRYAFPFEPVLMMAAAAGGTLSAGATRHRWLTDVSLAFIAWGWVAWAVFAWTSR
jgi:hypothetical protein